VSLCCGGLFCGVFVIGPSILIYMKNLASIVFIALLISFLFSAAQAEEVKFDIYSLKGEEVTQPTSLDFGPDDRLYVLQQNGIIHAFDIERASSANGEISYRVVSSEKIDLIADNTTNHNELGEVSGVIGRLSTGILVAGTVDKPVIYVTSANPLVGGGLDEVRPWGDTNSGVLSRLSWTGKRWERVDLVRGLPKSVENHTSNGLALYHYQGKRFLLLAQGGMTNKGAPSRAFGGLGETVLSGAILRINLSQLDSMRIYNDPRTNAKYVYDLPTLNDPERRDIDNSSPEFPYPQGHPLYTHKIDIGDPFGGNGGLNQAFVEVGSPVSVFAPGFRNPYDVLVNKLGNVFTIDNGANSGWGGLPYIYGANGDKRGTEIGLKYQPSIGHTVSNELSEVADTRVHNPLHHIGNVSDPDGTYYGGHPRPVVAFPNQAKINRYKIDSTRTELVESYIFSELYNGTNGYFNTDMNSSMLENDHRQGTHWSTGSSSGEYRIRAVEPVSTNGLAEYTASAFGGSMTGDVLAASFDGSIVRYSFNSDNTIKDRKVLFNGFGSTPLDLLAQSDTDIFPATIWAITYGAANVTIFEPKSSKLRSTKIKSAGSKPINVNAANSLKPLIRINTGGAAKYSSDNEVHWLADSYDGIHENPSYSVNSGQAAGFTLNSKKRHSSIPPYITDTDYKAIFSSERWDKRADPELEYKIAIDNGSYTVNLYMGDGFDTTARVGARVFDIYIEDELVYTNFDITKQFGVKFGGMLQVETSVADGQLNIRFGNKTQNPLINAIEVMGTGPKKRPNKAANEWVKIDDQNFSAKHHAGFVAASDRFMLFGGRERPPQAQFYNPENDSWDKPSPIPRQFHHTTPINYDGLIWVLDGFINVNFPKETPIRQVHIYNPALQHWFTGRPIPKGRRRGAAAVVEYKGKLYVVGGNTLGHFGGAVSYLDVYDPVFDSWTALPNAPRARDHLSASVIEDKLYVVAGRQSGGIGGLLKPLIGEVDVYDFTTETWTTLPTSSNLPSLRAGATTAVIDQKIHLIGGENSASAIDTVEVFDPLTQKWKLYPGLNTRRNGAQALQVANTIYLAAGSPNLGRGVVQDMERLGPPVKSLEKAELGQLKLVSQQKLGDHTQLDLLNTSPNLGMMINNISVTDRGLSISNEPTRVILSGQTLTLRLSGTQSNRSEPALLRINYDDNKIFEVELEKH